MKEYKLDEFMGISMNTDPNSVSQYGLTSKQAARITEHANRLLPEIKKEWEKEYLKGALMVVQVKGQTSKKYWAQAKFNSKLDVCRALIPLSTIEKLEDK